MLLKKSLLIVIVIMASAVLTCMNISLSSAKDVQLQVVEAMNAFGLNLYGKLKKSDNNLFFSPYSASVALTMALAGTKGETASQMVKVLHYNQSNMEIHSILSSLNQEILKSGKAPGIRLNTANAIWGQKGFDFHKQFLNIIKTHYGSAFRQVDFENAPQAAAAEINQWASKQTEGRIQDIVRDLDRLTRFILANAIYFKGKWAHQFKEKMTKKDDFFLLNGNKTSTMMMHQTDKFGYMEIPDFQILEAPYQGGDLSMVVLLPRRRDGLLDSEQSLSIQKLHTWFRELRDQKVEIYLPKFKVTDSLSLKDSLQSLGMVDAFSAKTADFTGMSSPKDPLFIGKVLQKTFIDVNEEGTEAAAVTTVALRIGMIFKEPPPIPVFRADHPFIFFILHKKTNCILFMGRITNPEE